MKNFPSNIYIDGGDPAETKEADRILKKVGYHGLDGQTTNPTLIAKRFASSKLNPPAGGQNSKQEKITEKEAFDYYKKIVQEMSKIIPKGKISIQVIGDPATLTSKEMVSQARERLTWIPNAIIKMPCTKAGLAAVEVFCQEGPINVTLNFSQEQAAAVYVATLRRGVSPQGKPYDVFISPFVGRLDDKGEKGMDVVANELEMYRALGDGHIKIITASVRNIKHLMYALWLKSDIVTIPFKIFKEWSDPSAGSGQVPFALPPKDFLYDEPDLTEIPYKELTLDRNWQDYDLHHDLTDAGVSKFWEDWKSIVA